MSWPPRCAGCEVVAAVTRMGLRAQVALLLAAGLLIAQAVNLGLALEQRRAGGWDAAADIAAARLADRVAGVDGREPRPRAGRRNARLAAVAAGAPREAALERAVGERLAADYGLRLPDIRAVSRPGGRRARSRLIVSATAPSGEPVAVAVRGPAPVGPLVAALVGQTLVILLALLAPLLWLLGRATRPLERLTAAVRGWRPDAPAPPLAPSGPADVRELTAAFTDLRERIDRLLAEKDVMLGAIGHDLRTPLAALRLEVEGVAEDAVREPMVASLDRLGDELESILALARTARALPESAPVELAALLAEVVAGRASVRLGTAGPAVVAGDAAALRRAFANLVDNAVRYGGGARVSLTVEGARAVARVADDGPGLSAAQLARAGEPFVRFEDSRNRATGGHGLGLAIARAIVERHGGALRLANGTEGGLEATVTLPLAG